MDECTVGFGDHATTAATTPTSSPASGPHVTGEHFIHPLHLPKPSRGPPVPPSVLPFLMPTGEGHPRPPGCPEVWEPGERAGCVDPRGSSRGRMGKPRAGRAEGRGPNANKECALLLLSETLLLGWGPGWRSKAPGQRGCSKGWTGAQAHSPTIRGKGLGRWGEALLAI